MKNFKTIIGVALAVVWGAIFLVMPATAAENANIDHNGSAEHKSTANATGRGVATFGMNFSASANTTGDFENNGMMQNIFGGQAKERPYYYQVK